jgi:4-amino-4-deoxy-L-arabinose transferase-like glycosyltransferase
VAAAGYALNIYLIRQTGQFMTETLFIFLQTAALVALCVGLRLKSGAALAWGAGGLLLGLATLTRPVILFFPLWVVVWLLFHKRHEWRRWLVPAAAFLVVFALTLVPWSLRNRVQMGKAVIVSTVGGQTFYHSNHAQSDGKWFPLPVPEEARGLSEAERDGYYYRQGLVFVFSEPVTTANNVVKKLLRLYYVFHPEYDFSFVIILLLALPGLWLYWRRGGEDWIPLLLVVYTTVLCLVFWGTPRFRLPLMPCFLVFVGYWVAARIWTGEGRRPERRYLVYAATVVGANLLLAWWAQPVRALVKSLVSGG